MPEANESHGPLDSHPPSLEAADREALLADALRGGEDTLRDATRAAPPPLQGVPSLPGYEVLGEAARGGMGVVYRARHVRLGREVALKVMVAGEYATAEMLERFHRESRAAARLDHPSIVAVYDVGSQGPLHYFAMEWIEGESLASLIRRGRISERRAVEAIRDVARALAYAHAHGIVHRDVKPANVLVGDDGRARLADFGLVKDLSLDPMTLPGAALGTPSYMSPEQASGDAARIDARSDVYGLGATLYEALTGRPPFVRDGLFATITAILSEDVVPPRSIRPTVPLDLETVCLRALERDPARRYESADAFADDLDCCLAERPIAARPVSTVGRFLARWRRRRGAVAATIALAAILGVAGAEVARRDRVRAAAASRWAEADRLEAAGDLVGARDLLLGCTSTDPAAAERLRRLEETLAERVRTEHETRKQALQRAEEAEEAVIKASNSARVLSRWARLKPVAEEIERIASCQRMDPSDRRKAVARAWEQVARFLTETPDDPASRATALAFAGYLRALSGLPDEGLAMMRKAHDLEPDLPYGRLLEAYFWFASYMYGLSFSPVDVDIATLPTPSLQEETPEQVGYRNRALLAARDAGRARVWGGEAMRDFLDLLLGFLRVHHGKHDQVIAALDAALASPDLRPLATGLTFARAQVRYLAGRFEEAEADALEALRVRAHCPIAWRLLGQIRIHGGVAGHLRGEDARPRLREAIEALTRAIDREPPSRSGGFGWRGLAWLTLARIDLARDGEPWDAFERAARDFTREASLVPEDLGALLNLATVWHAAGRARVRAGLDPGDHYGKAEEILDRVLRINPKDTETLRKRGQLRVSSAEDLPMDARRREELFRSGVDDLRQSARIDPGGADSSTMLACALCSWTMRIEGDPRDGDERLREALDLLEEAHRRDPGNLLARIERAKALALAAERRFARGEEARASCEEAMRAFDEVASARVADAHGNRARPYELLASIEERDGGDPRPWLREGLKCLAEAVRLEPGATGWRQNRAAILIRLGEAELARGGDGDAEFARAEEEAGAIIARHSTHADAWETRGVARLRRAEDRKRKGGDPGDLLKLAAADVAVALGLDPKRPSTLEWKGIILQGAGEVMSAAGEDPRPAFRESLEAFDGALAMRPASVSGLVGRGDTCRHLGAWTAAVGEDGAPLYRAARDAYERAVEVDPGLWRAWFHLGLMREALGDLPGAEEACERASAIVGDASPQLAETLDRIRRARGK